MNGLVAEGFIKMGIKAKKLYTVIITVSINSITL
jgi:hypothetical protein